MSASIGARLEAVHSGMAEEPMVEGLERASCGPAVKHLAHLGLHTARAGGSEADWRAWVHVHVHVLHDHMVEEGSSYAVVSPSVAGHDGSDSPDRAELTGMGIAKAARLHGQPLTMDQVSVVGHPPRDRDRRRFRSLQHRGIADANAEHVLTSLTEPFAAFECAINSPGRRRNDAE